MPASQQLGVKSISWFREFLGEAYREVGRLCNALKYPPYSRERGEAPAGEWAEPGVLRTPPRIVESLISKLRADPTLAPLYGLLNQRLAELQTAFIEFERYLPGAPQVLPRHDVPGDVNKWDYTGIPQVQRLIAALRPFHELAGSVESNYFKARWEEEEAHWQAVEQLARKPHVRQRGRPRVDEKQHKRIVAAWGDGTKFPTYAECAKELGDVTEPQVKQAINREAQRRRAEKLSSTTD